MLFLFFLFTRVWGRYFFLVRTIFNTSSRPARASVSGKIWIASRAVSQNVCASSRVRCIPFDLYTNSRAYETLEAAPKPVRFAIRELTLAASPGSANFRAIIGPSSGNSSHA
jgi:hypothetical protein